MAILATPTYYRDGASGASAVIGYESKRNRVVRFSFVTGADGGTGINITIPAGTIIHGNGNDMTTIPFYVTTSSTSHANANAEAGSAVTGYIYGSSGAQYSGSANITLLENTTYYLWFFPNSTFSGSNEQGFGWSYWYNNGTTRYTDCTITGRSRYAIYYEPAVGSSIAATRTFCAASGATSAHIGDLASYSYIYVGDILKLSCSPAQNYMITSFTANWAAVASESTYIVPNSDVILRTTAQVLASSVGATDANIGSVSSITVVKYNASYYHSLHYSFGQLSGYITESGGTQPDEVKIASTNIPFTIPKSFYSQIPNSSTGRCVITCRTYSDPYSTVCLGDPKTCEFTVVVTGAPVVSGSVIDVNSTTASLTGDNSVLIRYKSTAQAQINAEPTHSASISSVYINGIVPTNNILTIPEVSDNTFVFRAYDSRGSYSEARVTPTMIPYVQLTINPTLSRTENTGSTIELSFTGDVFIGSFGTSQNQLSIRYRFKESGSAEFGEWESVGSSDILYNVRGENTYASNGNIVLDNEFNYQKEYQFQVQAYDGTGEVTLTTATKQLTVPRGIPVFDWGEHDFNFNVPIMLDNVKLLNIIYPIGSIYISANGVFPDVMSKIGEWESIAVAGLSGVYSWKRIL